MRLLPLLLVVALGGAVPACMLFKRKPKATAAPGVPRPLAVGTVTLVNTGERFVLIDSGSLAAPEPGALLRCYAQGVLSAELTASGVRRRPFIIADIKSGTPNKGDRVEMPRFLEPVAATPVPAGPTLPPPTRTTAPLYLPPFQQ